MVDILIVGAGPAGINCAIAAQKAGLDYVILEKGVLVNTIYKFPTNMLFFSTSKNLEIGEVPFISHSDKPSRSEALEYYRRISEYYNLKISFKQEVKGISKTEDFFAIKTQDQNWKAKKIVLATGFYDHARMLNIPGESLHKVKHFYDDAHPYIGMNVVVVGAANSACDVALETWQKGANVTMVIRKEKLYEKVKYWILPNIQNRIKEGSIKAYFSSSLVEIKPNEVDILTPEGKISIANDYVLAMTGYHPNFELLSNFGVKFSDDPIRTPIFDALSLESSVEGIYLAGVILGGNATSTYFIENTRDQGEKIIGHITQKIQE